MKLSNLSLCFATTISYLGLFYPYSINAQIVPDATLPNNSITIPNGNSIRIEGGTTSGNNLFHSFQEFSVPTGSEAFFNNAVDIQNIFSRVTGSNISNIDGLIRANGVANLFLINPNGIIFGQNAQLNIGGSFLSSTANSIRFLDGSEFSATNPTAPSLLTINVPIGLQFTTNPKSITNLSQATSLIPPPPVDTPIPIPTNVGLQVQPGQTLALVGGDVILNNGNLTAFQGEIHLASVASPGLVVFQPTATGIAFDYTGIANFGKIELLGTTSVNTSGFGGGAIALRGGTVILRDGASLISDTLGNIDGRNITIQATQLQFYDKAFIETGTLATGNAGNINLLASDSAQLTGSGFATFRKNAIEAPIAGKPNPFPRESSIFSSTIGAGKAGNITINTPQLILREGMYIGSQTFGLGDGGNITVKASESIDVVSSGFLSPVFNLGNGGNISIDTQRLSVREGSLILTTTASKGRGGDIIVRASDSVSVSTNRPDSSVPTSISTATVNNTGKPGNRAGDSGNIEINTRSLLVEGGATISSGSGTSSSTTLFSSDGARGGNITINATDSVRLITTQNLDSSGSLDDVILREANNRSGITAGVILDGVGGELTINTGRLVIEGGSGITTSILGSGSAGNIFINASESVELKDTTRSGLFPGGITSGSGEPLFQARFQLPPPTGSAGNININTPRLIVRNGATVSVGSLGTGSAGNINIAANAINLDTKGSIDGTTVAGSGANINLQARDIQLRRGSRITTDAGNTTGGNIDVNTNTLAALENSDITANAQKGSGGRVTITAQGIFGTQFRDRLTPQSDITATSDLGPQFNGTVEINTPDVDPSSGLVELSANFEDVTGGITTGCSATIGNTFTVTGRGALPANPTDALMGQVFWYDWRLQPQSLRLREQQRGRAGERRRSNQFSLTNSPLPMIEVTGWQINNKGQVELVANNSGTMITNPWSTKSYCRVQ